MKRKIGLVLVALTLCVSLLSACSKDDTSSEGAAGSLATGSSASSGDASSAVSSEEKKPKEESKKYEKGVLTDTTYESAFFNIKFTSPAEFVLTTEDEMLELAKQSGATVKSDGSLDYENSAILFEMVAAHTSGAPNVTIIAEKLPLKNITIEQYAESAKSQMSTSGMSPVDDGKTTPVTIGGSEYLQMQTTGSTQGIAITQDINMRKVGSYVVLLSVTYTDSDNGMKDNLLAGFAPYN